MAVAHKSKERMAWNLFFILLFHPRIRGHEIKLAGAVLKIKKGRHFFMQQARPVDLLAEWHCHRTADVGRDLWRLPSQSLLLRGEVYIGSREDCMYSETH